MGGITIKKNIENNLKIKNINLKELYIDKIILKGMNKKIYIFLLLLTLNNK